MTLMEFGVYVLLQLRADWATGIYRSCALTIAYQFGDADIRAQVKDILFRLRRKQYINYSPEKGKRGSYEILIHKFEPRVGRLTGTRLNAWKHGEKAIPEYEPIASDTPDSRLRIARESPEARPIQEERSNNKKLRINRAPARVLVRPTLEQVTAYCQERENNVNPQQFMDHYEANGWKVGKNPMRDWRAALRTWERNRFDSKPHTSQRPRDTHIIGVAPVHPPCSLGICDGSGWFIDRGSRKKFDCECRERKMATA